MTIRRQYTLPNCNLLLEGMSGDDALNPEAPMTILLNSECQFPGIADPLVGGRDFLEALVATVSRYAQSLLSGVPLPPPPTNAAQPLVSLAPEGPHRHRLSFAPTEKQTEQEATTAVLTTVQLFDLMEAIDQLLADAYTLPDLTLQLKAVPRRETKPQEPLVERAAPLAIGTSSLAAAAVALFFVPVPEWEPRPVDLSNPESAPTDNAVDDAAAADPPTADGSDPRPVDAPEAAIALDRLEAAPAIEDPDALEALQDSLVATLTEAWTAPAPDTDLVYRVAVSETGDILAYRYENDAALANGEATPLPTLTYRPVDPEAPVTEPIGFFRVTFGADGSVTAEPAGAPTATTSVDGDSPAADVRSTAAAAGDEADAALTAAIATEVREGDRLEAMNNALYDILRDSRDRRTFDTDLVYRVRFTEAGAVVGYEPDDPEAAEQVTETPLPELVETADADTPQADFRVVFAADGILQVSPWRGWPQ